MKVTTSAETTKQGPADWFTGDVFIDGIADVADGQNINASIVHFTPGARTAWHTHPKGQTIYVLEGIGRVQRQGEATVEIRPGDRVFFEPGENHWHGAAPHRFMAHVAMVEQDHEGNVANWGEHVSDADYLGRP